MHSSQGAVRLRHGAVPLLCAIIFVAAVTLVPSAGISADSSPDQSTPTVTLTPALPPPAPSATPVVPTPVPPGVNVCPQIVNKVPSSALSAAIANPRRVSGYNQPLDAGKPVSRYNPPRMWLSIHSYHKPYHPLFNSLAFKIGCP